MPPEQLLSRQMDCPACGHEHLWLDCERSGCGCVAHIQPGIYPKGE